MTILHVWIVFPPTPAKWQLYKSPSGTRISSFWLLHFVQRTESDFAMHALHCMIVFSYLSQADKVLKRSGICQRKGTLQIYVKNCYTWRKCTRHALSLSNLATRFTRKQVTPWHSCTQDQISPSIRKFKVPLNPILPSIPLTDAMFLPSLCASHVVGSSGWSHVRGARSGFSGQQQAISSIRWLPVGREKNSRELHPPISTILQ